MRYMADEVQVPPRQVAGFFDLLIETATAQTRPDQEGENSRSRFGQACEGATRVSYGRNPARSDANKIKAKMTIKFRLAKDVKNAVAPPDV